MKRRYQVQDQIYCVALVALLFPLDTEVLRPLEVEKEAQVKRAGYKAISAIRKYINTEEQRKRLGWSLKLKVPKEEQQENAECALTRFWAVGMRGVAMSSPGSVVSGFTHDAIRQVLEKAKCCQQEMLSEVAVWILEEIFPL